MPALYTATSLMTAIREANQAGDLQPTMLVSYDAEIENVFETRDEAALAAFGLISADLGDPGWRDQMRTDGTSRTQAFAGALITAGFHGMLVRSFARGATTHDLNLVLWRWNDTPPAKLTVVDNDGRLKPGAT